MEFGYAAPARVDTVDAIVRAEKLGFESAWFGDCQILWSDIYASMAVAAVATKRIRLGPGAAIAGTRIAPVTACSIASINRLAPGRTFIAIGSGNSAYRVMGQKPVRSVAQFVEYVRVVKGLLAGEEVEFTMNDHTAPIRFGMPELGYINIEDPIPVYTTGGGPRFRAVAGQLSDGLVDDPHKSPEAVAAALADAKAGARSVGREFPAEFEFSAVGTVVVLDDHEDLASDRVIREGAIHALLILRMTYQRVLEQNNGSIPKDVDLPPQLEAVWNDYRAMVDELPERARHMRLYAGHGTYVHPDEWRFATPDLIRMTNTVGRPEEIVEMIRDYERAGMTRLVLSCATPLDPYPMLERFSHRVMAKL